jgi:hypothetical protein
MCLFWWIMWDEVNGPVSSLFLPVWSSVKRWRHNIFVSYAGSLRPQYFDGRARPLINLSHHLTPSLIRTETRGKWAVACACSKEGWRWHAGARSEQGVLMSRRHTVFVPCKKIWAMIECDLLLIACFNVWVSDYSLHPKIFVDLIFCTNFDHSTYSN